VFPVAFAQEKKGLKFQIELGVKLRPFGINQCKVRIERGPTNKLSNKRQSTLSKAFQRKGSQ
jgi:hypothetical protein